MKPISSICWYLCGLFLFALLATSAITVAPGSERFFAGLMLLNGCCAVLCGGLAIILRRSELAVPGWLLRTFQGCAVLLTILVLFISVG